MLRLLGRVSARWAAGVVTIGWFAVTVLADLIGGALFVVSGAELPRLRAKATKAGGRRRV